LVTCLRAVGFDLVRECETDFILENGSSYFFSRLAADALAADLSSFAWLSPFVGLTAFFADVLFFAGVTLADLGDFFTIVARN
jgi:hypothetical protein